MTDREEAMLIVELCEAISPMIKGRGPRVQAAVIANLLGVYMAGWKGPGVDEMRLKIGRLVVEMALGFAEIEEKFDGRG